MFKHNEKQSYRGKDAAQAILSEFLPLRNLLNSQAISDVFSSSSSPIQVSIISGTLPNEHDMDEFSIVQTVAHEQLRRLTTQSDFPSDIIFGIHHESGSAHDVVDEMIARADRGWLKFKEFVNNKDLRGAERAFFSLSRRYAESISFLVYTLEIYDMLD